VAGLSEQRRRRERSDLAEQRREGRHRRLLPDAPDVEEAHERLVRMSLGSPHRPRGKRLVMRGTGRWSDGPAEIVLVEHFDDRVDPVPVPVPADVVPRAARVLRAIPDEAPR
jgi:hypothetical protein